MSVNAPLLKALELAGLLSVSPRTVYKLDWQVRTGLLPVRFGRSIRFRLEDVRALLEEQAAARGEARRHRRELDQLRRWATRHGIPWPRRDGGEA